MLASIFPSVITNNYIISQLIGVCALIVVCSGYFLKSRQQFFVTQMFGNFLVALSYLFLGTLFASIGVFIACIRSIVFYFYEKKQKTVPWWLLGVICALVLGNGVVLWSSPLDLLPMGSLILFKFDFRIKDAMRMRLVILFACFLFATFNLFNFHYAGLTLKTFEIIMITIAIIELTIQKRQRKRIALHGMPTPLPADTNSR